MHLADVDPRVRLIDVVEEQALLQGSERIDMLNESVPGGESFDLFLLKFNVLEVGGDKALGRAGVAGFDQLPPGVNHLVSEVSDGLYKVAVATVSETDGQLTAQHQHINLYEVVPLLYFCLLSANAAAKHAQGLRVSHHLIELSQVVEADLRLEVCVEPLSRFLASHELRHSV